MLTKAEYLSATMKKMLKLLSDMYMIDLICDEELQGYYEKLGKRRSHGMIL